MSRQSKSERISQQLVAAVAHHRGGSFEKARAIYRRIIETDARQADALHLLGTIELTTGRRQVGLTMVAKALQARPLFPEAWVTLGNALNEGADQSGARRAFRRAIAISPAMLDAIGNLSLTLTELAGTRIWLRRASTISPGSIEVLFNLGATALRADDFHQANLAFARALAIQPNFHGILAQIAGLRRRQASAEILTWLRRALAIMPDDEMNAANLGATLIELGDGAAAERLLTDVLKRQPENAEARANLGIVFRQREALDAALTTFRQAIALRPQHASAIRDIGTVMLDLGEVRAAVNFTRRAVSIDPSNVPFGRNLLATTLYDNEMSHATRWKLHRQVARTLPRNDGGENWRQVERDADRPIRVAYISSDLRAHPAGRVLASVFASHDPRAVTLVTYALTSKEDALTLEMRRHAAKWRLAAGLDDRDVAKMMRDDKIDIAVFMALHFDHNRPTLAVQRGAPIQISLGDVSSTGLDEIDYLISDRVLSPRRTQEAHSERVIGLPSIYYHPALSITLDPGRLPLTSAGYVTFGSFNLPTKLNDEVLRLWARVLDRVPNSRFVFRYRGFFDNTTLVDRVRREMALAGVDPERLTFLGRASSEHAYFDSLRAVDILLDPFPFNGHTSTFEALWMGIPVVTLAGKIQAGRFAEAQLRAVGLPDLVAASPDAYVEIAARLAVDSARLTTLREGLRERVRNSRLCDADRLTRRLERVYRAVWRRYCFSAAA